MQGPSLVRGGWSRLGAATAASANRGQGRSVMQAAVCSQCGRVFPPGEMIQYGQQWVCAACKPAFVQKLKEGASVASGDMVFGGFWRRFVAKFIDGIVLVVVNAVLGFMIGLAVGRVGDTPEFSTRTILITVITMAIQMAAGTFYYIWFVGKFAATPGKMALGLRIVKADGERVTYWRATGRMFAEYLSMLTLMVGYIMAGFDGEKRTLHDRVCNTRVIKR